MSITLQFTSIILEFIVTILLATVLCYVEEHSDEFQSQQFASFALLMRFFDKCWKIFGYYNIYLFFKKKI